MRPTAGVVGNQLNSFDAVFARHKEGYNTDKGRIKDSEDQQGRKTLKDTAMLKHLYNISALPDKDREHILYTIDGLIKSAKLQAL